MSINNPFAGGPDYVVALANAIDDAPNTIAQRPQSGGIATSVRIPEHRLAWLDEIAAASNWTRNEVINALLDKGLFILFHGLKDHHAESIMGRVQNVFLPSHGVSNMEYYKTHRIGAAAKQKTPSGRWYTTYQYSLEGNPSMVVTSQEWTPDFATEKEAIEHGRIQAIKAIESNLPWTVSIIRLPLPITPLSDGGPRGSVVVPPLQTSSVETALYRCRELMQNGYGVELTGPHGIRWDEAEIIQKLNSGFLQQVNVDHQNPQGTE